MKNSPLHRIDRLLIALTCLCALQMPITTHAQSNYEPYSFTTLAGIASSGDLTAGADGTGSAARFSGPSGVATDGAGNVYVADTGNETIRKITPAGVVATLAGLAGSSGSDDGTACAARFNGPRGVAVDAAGNVYVADTDNHTIRKITPAGVVTTLAGLAGSAGSDDGTGSAARFDFPEGVAVDSAGNVYVADYLNHTIRKITPAGVVTTLAGLAGSYGSDDGTGSVARFDFPQGVAVDSAGNVYVADFLNYTIRKITPAGVVTTLAGCAPPTCIQGSDDGTGSAARFFLPSSVAVDSAGNVYVADDGNDTIRKITPAGVVTTVAGLAGSSGSADGTGSAARFNVPYSVALDGMGNIFVADYANDTIRKIAPDQVVTTLAGLAGTAGSTDGTGTAARFNGPNSVGVDLAGNVFVADAFNATIRKITPAGVVSTLAGLANNFGSDDGTGSAARFYGPSGVAVDDAGDVYVADNITNTIRKITPDGVVTTLAGCGTCFSGSDDGTGSAALFSFPSGVAVDGARNVYVADTFNNTIRKITPAGVVTTLAGFAGSTGSDDGTGSAARFDFPEGVAVDGAGNVYVADTINHTIRKVSPAGVVTTLAGLANSRGSADGTGSAARFNSPAGVAVDSAGNVYVADTGNYTIRKITQAGVVTTLAGLAGSTGSADGTGSAARFYGQNGVAVDGARNVYVADTGNNTIRVGVEAPPLITTIGQNFVYQLESTSGTSFGVSNLPPGLTFDPQLTAIIGTPTAVGTFQAGIAATYSGIATTSTLTIIVQPTPASGPVIASGTSATGKVGRAFSFRVYTTGGSPAARLSARGLPPGLSADPVTGIISGSAARPGSSIATLTVTDGSFTATATLQLTFPDDSARSVIISPGFAYLTPGVFFSYKIIASAACGSDTSTAFSFIGALPAGLTFDGVDTISGVYTGLAQRGARERPDSPELSGGVVLGNIQLFGTNSQGTATFPLLFLKAPSGAVNVSTRLQVGTGANVLIGGFIVSGTAPKVVMVRAIGPSTGIPSALQNVTLELHDSAGHVVFNDNWNDSQESLITSTEIAPKDFRESAIVIGLDPGNYTAIVAGKDGTTGIALVETYDLGTATLGSSGDSKLVNISTRGFVETGDNVMIGGFIVSGVPTKVVARAIGPSLGAFGITNALPDPTLELHNASGTTIRSNDDWKIREDGASQQAEIEATTLPPKDDRESAIVATLDPGNYTAIVRGKNNATGVALVEVYSLQ